MRHASSVIKLPFSIAVLVALLLASPAAWAAEPESACKEAVAGAPAPKLPACDPKFFPETSHSIGLDREDLREISRRVDDTVKKFKGFQTKLAKGGSKFDKGWKFKLIAKGTRKTACCGGQPTTLSGAQLGCEIAFELEQRFFYGIPYAAEVGIKLIEKVGT
jgi:hypothetical protein